MDNKQLLEGLNKVHEALTTLSEQVGKLNNQNPRAMLASSIENYAKNFDSIMETTQQNLLAHKAMFDKLMEASKNKIIEKEDQ